MNDNLKYIRMAILENIVEAQIIGSILEDENIPHQIRSYHDTAYDGLYQFQKGWGEISASACYEEQVLKILDDIRTENYSDQNIRD